MTDKNFFEEEEDDDDLFADGLSYADEDNFFADEEASQESGIWKVLVVDDEEDVHTVTRLAIEDVVFEGKILKIMDARSGAEARQILKENPDTALVLLDVVMESHSAGLDLVRHIREELGNQMIRIVLRTGQAGHAPERKVVVDYDINDYKTKTELTSEKLFSMVISAIRSYQAFHALDAYARDLEQKVRERTLDLNQALGKITDSLEYAQKIQSSLLPNPDEVRNYLRDCFFIWMPRDIVGGDIYFAEQFEDGIIIAVIDCTGHGVPGAFMSMIASSFIRRITTVLNCHDPAEILKQLNSVIKTSLQQERENALSDDGLDAAICFASLKDRTLTFAGAKLPLFCVHESNVRVIRGDRQSIGYKSSDVNFDFTNHTIIMKKGMSFYMSTDGFWDQLGGERRHSFDKKRFQNLLKEIAELPFEEQREILVQRFDEYKGENDRQDDVTVAGFGFQMS